MKKKAQSQPSEAVRDKFLAGEFREVAAPIMAHYFSPDSASFGSCSPFFVRVRPEFRVKWEYQPSSVRMTDYEERRLAQQSFLEDLIVYGLHHGDPAAVKLLMEIAEGYTLALNRIAIERPELLRPLARERIMWPALISSKKSQNEEIMPMMKHLELGTQSVMGGRWHSKSPATVQAACMHRWLLDNAKILNLPPFSNGVRRQWFDTAWAALLEVTNNRPDLNPHLAPIGKNAIGKKSTSRGMAEQTQGMKQHDVVASIKGQLWRSYQNFVRFPTKRPPDS